MISKQAVVYPICEIGKDVTLYPFSVIGVPPRMTNGGKSSGSRATIIGDQVIIGSHVIVEEGVKIGQRCVVEHGAVIERDVKIEPDVFIVHGARLLVGAQIGERSVVGGFIADRASIGCDSRVFGHLIHRQDNPTTDWDTTIEVAPRLDNYVFVGIGALVIGPVKIGESAYICANAVVTKDVPPYHVVSGTNNMVPVDKWKGRLRQSAFWEGGRNL